MARARYYGLRRSVAVIVCLLGVVALLAGSSVARAAGREPLRVLQMNLCDSGIAPCYTGRSVAQAAEMIRTQLPDVVTLDEVCGSDVHALEEALAAVRPAGTVVAAFRAAGDRRTGAAFHCRNGQPYGIGLLVHLAPGRPAALTSGGVYPTQDTGDPEERVWLCVEAVGRFYACATHLASTSRQIALAQCRYLLTTAIAATRARDGYQPTVLGGDLNLSTGSSPDVRSCVPAGYTRRDDGQVQHVLATADLAVLSSRSLGMGGTTDHPALLVTVAVPATSN